MSSGAELRAAGIIVPANPKNPVAKAEHIEMPDGKRLSEFNPVSSWNDLTDKPFGEVDAFEPIVWDGKTDGLFGVDIAQMVDVGFDSLIMYRIFDRILLGVNYFGSCVQFSHRGGIVSVPLNLLFDTGSIRLFEAILKEYDNEGGKEEFRVFVASVSTSNELGLPHGVFCSELYRETVPLNGTPITIYKKNIIQIDPKYLPDDAPEIKAAESGAVLEPGVFYEFGEVGELAVTLAQKDDGKAHEYWFDFEPAEGFAGLTITPEPRWMAEPQYPVGKTVRVGIWNGMAVMGIV